MFMRLVWVLAMVILASITGISESFAEKITSIQKTVDVDRISLTESLIDLENYSQILPDYVQSSRLVGDDVGNLKIGLDWISIDTNVKFAESDDRIVLEVISGDFKDTTLSVMMTEKTNPGNVSDETNISAEINLQRSWTMKLLTSFISDDDIESMLHTSLDGLVEYTKNPRTSENVAEEKESFCIFGFCF
jgi:hypothetical protein